MGLNYRGRRISVKTYSVVRDMASYAVTGAVVLLVSAEPQIKTRKSWGHAQNIITSALQHGP